MKKIETDGTLTDLVTGADHRLPGAPVITTPAALVVYVRELSGTHHPGMTTRTVYRNIAQQWVSMGYVVTPAP